MTRLEIVSFSLFIFLFFAFFPVIYDLRDSVMGNELAHHAPLVFALVGFLVYRKRGILTDCLKKPMPQGGPEFFVAGLCLNLLGQAAGIYYLAQISLPLTVFGMARYIVGVQFARQLIFPLLFLLLAFPIPGKIYMDVIFPLKLLVTKTSGIILTALGYPVKIHGNIIEISSVFLGVVDACSGLSSLMAILTLSMFYSYLVIKRGLFRLTIVLSMLPLIILANVFRVTATAIVAVKWGSEMSEGTLHTLWGIVVFVLAVLGLIAITNMFRTLESREAHDL